MHLMSLIPMCEGINILKKTTHHPTTQHLTQLLFLPTQGIFISISQNMDINFHKTFT